MRRKLGITNLKVFPVGLGAMLLALRHRPPIDEAVKVVHAAIEAGVEFIDTANVYCTDNQDIGLNERTIAQALASIDSENIVVATKGGLTRPQGRWERRGSPQRLRSACEQSLTDLNVEAITLYQLHAPDSMVPFSDSVGELSRLQSEGKIIHIGLSNVTRELLDEARSIATITSVQNRCNVFRQTDVRNGMIEHCRNNSITYIAYSPLGGGSGIEALREEPALTEIAHAHGATVFQIALAWLLRKRDNILPIPGASRISSAVSSAHAAKIELTDEDMERLDALGDL